MRIELEDGKYTYISHEDGGQEVLRYGEPWRDLTGDKFIYCLAAQVQHATELLRKQHDDALVLVQQNQQQAGDMLRLIETVKYLRGIAERGSGGKCPDDMTVEAFVLGYVKNLEQNIKQQAEVLRVARASLLKCRDGFEYTRQYVGYEMLPAIKGWSWFDGDQAAQEALAAIDALPTCKQSLPVPQDLSDMAQTRAAELRGNVARRDFEAWALEVLPLLDWMTFANISKPTFNANPSNPPAGYVALALVEPPKKYGSYTGNGGELGPLVEQEHHCGLDSKGDS